MAVALEARSGVLFVVAGRELGEQERDCARRFGLCFVRCGDVLLSSGLSANVQSACTLSDE